MPHLLHIDSSPMYGMSVSRQLTGAYTDKWETAHPNETVTYRDLNALAIPCLDAAWIKAAYTPQEARNDDQRNVLALSDELITELQNADEWVIGVPMHNFSISSPLKLWIDQITRVGKSFAYAEGRPKGLLKGKKVTFFVATGSNYDAGTHMASLNHAEPYLRSAFGFVGVNDTTFITAGGTSALQRGSSRVDFMAPHLKAVDHLFV